jgi:uncharacterized damage-inducible protein DinB
MLNDWRVHFIEQTEYQIWANQVLFDTLARLHMDALQADQGLYFGSIHRTVEHMLAATRTWAAQLRDDHANTEIHSELDLSWSEAKHELQRTLRELRHWLPHQSTADFSRPVRYTRTGGEVHRARMADILTHLMTHLTHHRGQISAVAFRLGAPAAETHFLYFLRDMERAAREARL